MRKSIKITLDDVQKLSACDCRLRMPNSVASILHWNSFYDNTVVSFGPLAEFIRLFE